jgi:hypothetical protein
MVSITKTRAVASVHRPAAVDDVDVVAGLGGDRAVASFAGLPPAGRGRLAPMATAYGTAMSAVERSAADLFVVYIANTPVASGSPPRESPV